MPLDVGVGGPKASAQCPYCTPKHPSFQWWRVAHSPPNASLCILSWGSGVNPSILTFLALYLKKIHAFVLNL